MGVPSAENVEKEREISGTFCRTTAFLVTTVGFDQRDGVYK